MSERAASSGKKGEGKKEHKNHPPSYKYKNYTITGNTSKKSKECIKCGPGIFLAQHKDRFSCGKCGYTEFISKAK